MSEHISHLFVLLNLEQWKVPLCPSVLLYLDFDGCTVGERISDEFLDPLDTEQEGYKIEKDHDQWDPQISKYFRIIYI